MQTKNMIKRVFNSVVDTEMTHREAYESIAIECDRRGHNLNNWGGSDEFIRALLTNRINKE